MAKKYVKLLSDIHLGHSKAYMVSSVAIHYQLIIGYSIAIYIIPDHQYPDTSISLIFPQCYKVSM